MGIRLRNVCKVYPDGTEALRDITLELDKGVFGLLGPNGAGKSTLMKIITTVLRKTSGTINVFGHDLEQNLEKVRTLTGYLPQDYGLYGNLTAAEFLDYICLFYQLYDREVRQRLVTALLAEVDLLQHGNQPLHTYSGGMKRRLGIAQALINRPRLLVVDEPTAGLDPEQRVKFRALLRDLLLEDEERVVILSTHIVNDVSALCSRTAILDKGRLLYNGAVDSLLQRAEGKVWEVTAQELSVRSIEKQVRVISSRVGGPDCVRVKYVADTPLPDSRSVEPQLEDAYMCLLERSRSNDD